MDKNADGKLSHLEFKTYLVKNGIKTNDQAMQKFIEYLDHSR